MQKVKKRAIAFMLAVVMALSAFTAPNGGNFVLAVSSSLENEGNSSSYAVEESSETESLSIEEISANELSSEDSLKEETTKESPKADSSIAEFSLEETSKETTGFPEESIEENSESDSDTFFASEHTGEILTQKYEADGMKITLTYPDDEQLDEPFQIPILYTTLYAETGDTKFAADFHANPYVGIQDYEELTEIAQIHLTSINLDIDTAGIYTAVYEVKSLSTGNVYTFEREIQVGSQTFVAYSQANAVEHRVNFGVNTIRVFREIDSAAALETALNNPATGGGVKAELTKSITISKRLRIPDGVHLNIVSNQPNSTDSSARRAIQFTKDGGFVTGTDSKITVGNNATIKGSNTTDVHPYPLIQLLGGSSCVIGGTSACFAKVGDVYGQGIMVEHGAGLTLNAGGRIQNCNGVGKSDRDNYQSGGGVCNLGTFTMTGGIISDCSAGLDGGGVAVGVGNMPDDSYYPNYQYFTGAKMTMTGGTISGNTAKDSGGGISVNVGSSLTMSAGTISSNETQNVDTEKDGRCGTGGGIMVWGSAAITGGTVSGNVAATGAGICANMSENVYIDKEIVHTFSNGTFTMNGTLENPIVIKNNTSKGAKANGDAGNRDYGGGLTIGSCVGLASDIHVSECEFSGNTAVATSANFNSGFGGGIGIGTFANSSRSVTFKNVIIKNNQASNAGGGLYTNSKTSLETCTITNNNATNDTTDGNGGAIFVNDSAVVALSGSSIHDNFADNRGGAILNRGVLTIHGEKMYRNTAKSGSALYNTNQAIISGGLIYGNTGYADDTQTYTAYAVVNQKKLTVSGNPRFGVSVYNSWTDYTVNDNDLGNIHNGTDAILTFNGSAIRLISTEDCMSLSNAGTAIVEKSTSIADHTMFMGEGKAIHNRSAGILTVHDGFRVNSSEAQNRLGIYNEGIVNMKGGQIYRCLNRGVENHKTFNLSGGSIASNASSGTGAGIYNTGIVNMTGGEICKNTASGNGGGIMNKSGASVTISAGSIDNNQATNGAGIFDEQTSKLVLSSEGSIHKNTASGNGGGVCHAGDGTLTINGKVYSNCAVKGGGICTYRKTILYGNSNGLIYGNTGYGVYNLNNSDTVSELTIKGALRFGVSQYSGLDDYTISANTKGNLYNDSSSAIYFVDDSSSLRLVSYNNINLDNYGRVTIRKGSLNTDGTAFTTYLYMLGTGTGIYNHTGAALTAGFGYSIGATNEGVKTRLGLYNEGDATLTGGYVQYCSNRGIRNSGTLTIHAGTGVKTSEDLYTTIRYNSYNGSAGGVWNDGGTISMTTADIHHNETTNGSGAGIYNNGTLQLSASGNGNHTKIYANTASTLGAGVMNKSGSTHSFTMSAGEIYDNTAASHGGGVFNEYDSTRPDDESTFIMKGGEIRDNTAGGNGSGVWNGGTFKMSGAANVKWNASTKKNDIYLRQDPTDTAKVKVIEVNGALTTSGIVGMITPQVTAHGTDVIDVNYKKADGSTAYGDALVQGSGNPIVAATDKFALKVAEHTGVDFLREHYSASGNHKNIWIAHRYKVTYHANLDSVTNPTAMTIQYFYSKEAGTKIQANTYVDSAGHNYLGFSTNAQYGAQSAGYPADFTTYGAGAMYTTEQDLDLYAIWDGVTVFDLNGTVEWVDDSNAYDSRPTGSVIVYLYQNGSDTPIASQTVKTGGENSPTTGNSFSFTFKGIDKTDANGIAYTYTVKQEPEPPMSRETGSHYETTYDQTVLVITNTRQPNQQLGVIKGHIYWVDEDNVNDLRPTEVKVTLIQKDPDTGAEAETEKVVDVIDGYYEFSDLSEVTANKNYYQYTVVQEVIASYETETEIKFHKTMPIIFSEYDEEIVDFTNYLHTITVTKEVAEDEVYFQHGMPAFFFELTGEDGHVYRKAVQITEDMTPENGVYQVSCSFIGISSQKYQLTEMNVLRYALADVKDTSINTIPINTGAIFTIGNTKENVSGKVTFVNIKENWFGGSDSVLVVNELHS